MEKKKIDIYMTVGIVVNVLLIAFFVFLYFGSRPSEDSLVNYGSSNISSLSIYNDTLNKEMGTLKRNIDLPINIDPGELGKQNPYNP